MTKTIRQVLNELHFENIAHINGSHASDDSHVVKAEQALKDILMECVGEDDNKEVRGIVFKTGERIESKAFQICFK